VASTTVVPVGMAVDQRVVALADDLGLSMAVARDGMLRIFLYCAERGSGGVGDVPDMVLNAVFSGGDPLPNFATHFRRRFVTSGIFVWFEELNAPTIRRRNLAAVRMQRLRRNKAMDKAKAEHKAFIPSPPPRIESAAKKELLLADAAPRFAEAWGLYPKRKGGNPRAMAARSYRARLNEGVSEEELVEATKHYAAFVRSEGKEKTSYVLLGSTFYGPNGRWADFRSAVVDETPEFDDVLGEVERAYAN
jgi:hypothetical protein